MALSNTDLFIVQRAGVHYKLTSQEILDFVSAQKSYTVADVAARDAQTGVKVGDTVFVTDASADSTVAAGWAVYRYNGAGPAPYTKISEKESLDVVAVATDLAVTKSPTNVIVTSTSGTDATIDLADATNAGLMSPAQFSALHPAATSDATPASNPVIVDAATQKVSFDINGLTQLP